MHIELTYNIVYSYVLSACALGFLYGLYNWVHVTTIDPKAQFDSDRTDRKNLRPEQIAVMNETSEKIHSVSYLIKI